MARQEGNRDLTPDEKMQLIGYLTACVTENGKLKFGSQAQAARRFGIHRNTVRTVWGGGRDSVAKKRGGSKRHYDPDSLKDIIASIPHEERMTVRSTAAAASVATSTLQSFIGPDGPLRRVTVHVKPTLSEGQKQERLRFVMSFVDRPLGLRHRYFDDMTNTVHVDEKWFYIHKVSSTFILTEDEDPLYLACHNKRYITKVMFLAALAHPRYDYGRHRGFTGKVGIFPLVHERETKRTTKNQTKGDLISEALSVDRHVYYECLTEKVFPAIMKAWPGQRRRAVYLQQDNATPHVSAGAAARDSGFGGT